MFNSKEIPKEIVECRKRIGEILDRPKLFVQIEQLDLPNYRYHFSGEDGSPASAGDRNYSVVPFYKIGDTLYWIGLTVDVMLNRAPDLKSVSLIVFEGAASSEEKIPAFRAEWDYTDPLLNNNMLSPTGMCIRSLISQRQKLRDCLKANLKLRISN